MNWKYEKERIYSENDKGELMAEVTFKREKGEEVNLNIDEIDLRIFSGSLQTYIEETEPDLVISMYSAYDLNASGAEALFEFN